MSRIYNLVGCKTYVVASMVFVEGKTYTEEQLGPLVTASLDGGETLLFAEVTPHPEGTEASQPVESAIPEAPVPAGKKLTFNKKGAPKTTADPPAAPPAHSGGDDEQAPEEGEIAV